MFMCFKKIKMKIKSKVKITLYIFFGIVVISSLVFFILNRENGKDAIAKKTISMVASQTTLNTPFNSQLEISLTSFPNRDCNILNYGGVGDGKTANTQAFADAINDCAKGGGGRVVVPPGVWFTGPIKLQSNIDLEVQKGAQILFSPNPEDYLPVVFSRFEGIEYYNYSPPIYAKDCENVAITGEGTLNGQGDVNWWNFSSADISKLYSMGAQNIPVDQRVFGTVQSGLRPDFIEFVNCQRVLVEGVTLLKGPMWTIHPFYSQNVIIKNVDIETAPGPSTDGIVIDSSQNVLVDGATLNTGDDAIVLKSGRDADGRRVGIPSENIVIQNCHVIYGHGALAIGSEMSGGIRNVLAQNITVDIAKWGFRTKANSDRGGTVENIWVENFNIRKVEHEAIVFDMMYEDQIMSGLAQYKPIFQNINISDFKCGMAKDDAIDLIGITNASGSLQDLNFKNIAISSSKEGLNMNDVQNVNLDTISLSSNPKYGAPYILTNTQNVTLSNSDCQPQMPNCFSLLGKSSQNINLINNNFDQQAGKIIIGKGTNKNALNIQ
jgi:polygalacturonase